MKYIHNPETQEYEEKFDFWEKAIIGLFTLGFSMVILALGLIVVALVRFL